MEKEEHTVRRERIRGYFSQPSELPPNLEKTVAVLGRIELFAFVDLNAQFQLSENWLVLTREALVFAHGDEVQSRILRSEIADAKVVQGLSANRLRVFGQKGQLLLEVCFTHRQRRAVSHIAYLLEESGKERKAVLSEKSAEEIYHESVVQPLEDAQNARNTNKMAVVWRLLGFLKPYRPQVALGMCGAALLTLVSLVPAYLTGYVFDHILQPHAKGELAYADALRMAGIAILGLLLVNIAREVFAWFRLRWMAVLGEFVARDLRRKVYTHLHRLSLSFFSSKQTGSLISRVGSDTDRIWDFIAFGVVEVSSSLLMLFGLGSVLLFLDWKLGLVVVLPVPVLLFMIHRHGQEMQQLFLRAWRKWSDLTDCLSDTIPGIRVVKAFNQQENEKRKFNTRNEATVREFNRIHDAWTTFWPKLMMSIHFIVVIVWAVGAPRVLIGQEAGESHWMGPMTAGTFVSFVLYLTMFVQPIEIIGQMARMINRATSSAHRVFEVLDTEPQILDQKEAKVLEQIRGDIEFRNVGFSYDGVRPIIRDMSFEIRAGEFIGLVGSSGGGKSTLTNLLTRFYDVDSGQVLVDGHDVRSLETEGFRNQIGMVLQDPYLFHGTVLENIRYSNPQASLSEVVNAAQAAHAHEFIMNLTHGYDTLVGERGATLSGGERQRISIARAILRDPRILILDEATSAVDTETEFKIQEAIDRLVQGRTVIAIAHRLSTLRRADRLIVIKNGRIVEQGTHSELVDLPEGQYAKLSAMQQRMNEAYLM